jgi:hypothetical protein
VVPRRDTPDPGSFLNVYWHAARRSLDNESFVLPWSQLSDVEPWVDPDDRQLAIECGSLQPHFAFVVDAAAWSNDVDGFVHSGLFFINPDQVWVYEVLPEHLQSDQSSLDPPAGAKSCRRLESSAESGPIDTASHPRNLNLPQSARWRGIGLGLERSW